MPRIYTVVFSAVAVSAAQDLFEITPADDKPVAIIGMELIQTSDFGDAQDEVLRVTIVRGFTSSGSGGSAPTPGALNPADAAAAFTAEVNNTTQANTGTTVTLWEGGWNVRAGYINKWSAEERFWATQANTTIVVKQTVPADAITMSGTLWVLEQ